MAMIEATKSVKARPTYLEASLFSLRQRAKDNDIYGEVAPYEQNNRDANADTLRSLWRLYEDAAMLMETLEAVFLAQTQYGMTSLIEVMSPRGERSEVSMALSLWRTHKPQTLGKFLAYDETSFNRQLLDKEDGSADAHTDFLREYCEVMAVPDPAKFRPTVVLSIHNPELLVNYHNSAGADRKMGAMLSVNVDKRYTWTQRERPTFLRLTRTTLPAAVTKETLVKMATRFCDSIRLMGESIGTEGCVYDRPAVNQIVAAMVELSGILNNVTHRLKLLNAGIMQEMSAYRGFQFVGRNVSLDEAKAIRYAAGVTIVNACAPVHTRDVETLKIPTVRGLVKARALNVDTPKLGFRLAARAKPLPWNPDYAPLWEQGRAAVRKSIDPALRKIIEAQRGK